MQISIQLFNWADYAILLILALSAFISLMRGFVKESISIATWIIAILIALRFGGAFSNYLVKYIPAHTLRGAVAFGGLFLITLILGGIINILFSRLVDRTGLGGPDRILGVAFGLIRGGLLIAVLILLGQMLSMNQESWWHSSQLIPYFQSIAKWLEGFVPNQIAYLTGLLR